MIITTSTDGSGKAKQVFGLTSRVQCRVRKLAPRLAHLDEGVRVNYAVLLGQRMPNC